MPTMMIAWAKRQDNARILGPCFADLGFEASSRPSTSLAPFSWVLHAKIGSDPAGISTVTRGDLNTAKTGRLVSQT